VIALGEEAKAAKEATHILVVLPLE